MRDHTRGCGKDDGPRTLFRLADGSPPVPLGDNYWHVRCGYRPPSKIQNGILLCDVCIAKLGLAALVKPSYKQLPFGIAWLQGHKPYLTTTTPVLLPRRSPAYLDE